MTSDNEILREKTFLSPGITFAVSEQLMWIQFYAGNKYRRKGFFLHVERSVTHGKIFIWSLAMT